MYVQQQYVTIHGIMPLRACYISRQLHVSHPGRLLTNASKSVSRVAVVAGAGEAALGVRAGSVWIAGARVTSAFVNICNHMQRVKFTVHCKLSLCTKE